MNEHDTTPEPSGGDPHKPAGRRAFELFFRAAEEADGIGKDGVKALKALADAGHVSAANVMSVLFPPQDEKAKESPDAEVEAPDSASI